MGVWLNQELGMNAQYFIHKTKGLLYSTVNATQYSVITYERI